MGFLFGRKRTGKPHPPEDLLARLEKMEAQLKEMPHAKTEYHIRIDQVHVHHPALDQLTFKLDSLDIDELSGSLNLGNNFGTGVPQPKKTDEKKPGEAKSMDRPQGTKTTEANSPQSSGSGFQQTPRGFSFRK